MDPRLFNAARTGNVAALSELLHEDPLIIQTVTLTSSDTPLHVASLLGHTEFARLVMGNSKELARELNQHGFSPMHLASSKGYLEIVKDLLKVDKTICLIKDRGGRIPLHSAAIKGRIDVIRELVSACPGTARERTPRGETILHLAVKNSHSEALVSIVHLLRELNLEDELINSKNDNGETILHLAVAQKKLEMVKYLVTQTKTDLNAVSAENFTPLDVLVVRPIEADVKDIEEVLRGAGAQSANNASTHPEQVHVTVHDSTTPPNVNQTPSRSTSYRGDNNNEDEKVEDWIKNGIMIFAVMFATLSFEAALNPPGGLWQEWPEYSPTKYYVRSNGGGTLTGSDQRLTVTYWFYNRPPSRVVPNVTMDNQHRPGKVINRELSKQKFFKFLLYDTICFFSSIFTIVLTPFVSIMNMDRHEKTMYILMLLMISYSAMTVFFTGVALVTDDQVSEWAWTSAIVNMLTFIPLALLLLWAYKMKVWKLCRIWKCCCG